MEPHEESEVDRKRQLPEKLVLGTWATLVEWLSPTPSAPTPRSGPSAVASGNISWSDASIGMQRVMKMVATLLMDICLIMNMQKH